MHGLPANIIVILLFLAHGLSPVASQRPKPVVTDSDCRLCEQAGKKCYFSGARHCCMCRPGYHLSEHCRHTDDTHHLPDTTVCVPCETGTYMPRDNNETACFEARESCEALHYTQVERGNATTDSRCVCTAGTYSKNPGDAGCKPYLKCPKGFGVIFPGNRTHDVKCSGCGKNTFSDVDSSTMVCRTHRSCGKGEKVLFEGDQTRDRECGNDSNETAAGSRNPTTTPLSKSVAPVIPTSSAPVAQSQSNQAGTIILGVFCGLLAIALVVVLILSKDHLCDRFRNCRMKDHDIEDKNDGDRRSQEEHEKGPLIDNKDEGNVIKGPPGKEEWFEMTVSKEPSLQASPHNAEAPDLKKKSTLSFPEYEAIFKKKGYRITFDPAKDGNCQFAAVAQFLPGTQDHSQLRKDAVEHLEQNQERYEDFLDKDRYSTYEKYISQMSRSGEYGDELTLRALSARHRVAFRVVQTSKDRPIDINESGDEEQRPFILGHVDEDSGMHYVCLEPLNLQASNVESSSATQPSSDARFGDAEGSADREAPGASAESPPRTGSGDAGPQASPSAQVSTSRDKNNENREESEFPSNPDDETMRETPIQQSPSTVERSRSRPETTSSVVNDQFQQASTHNDESPDLKQKSMLSFSAYEEIFKKKGYRITFDPAKDGNCQFAAVAHFLPGTQDHSQLRKDAVEHLEQNQERYEDFLDKDRYSTYEKYISQMSRSGEYGDELTLRALSARHRVAFQVIQTSRNRPPIDINESGDEEQRLFILGHVDEDSGMHYVCLEPLNPQASNVESSSANQPSSDARFGDAEGSADREAPGTSAESPPQTGSRDAGPQAAPSAQVSTSRDEKNENREESEFSSSPDEETMRETAVQHSPNSVDRSESQSLPPLTAEVGSDAGERVVSPNNSIRYIDEQEDSRRSGSDIDRHCSPSRVEQLERPSSGPSQVAQPNQGNLPDQQEPWTELFVQATDTASLRRVPEPVIVAALDSVEEGCAIIKILKNVPSSCLMPFIRDNELLKDLVIEDKQRENSKDEEEMRRKLINEIIHSKGRLLTARYLLRMTKSYAERSRKVYDELCMEFVRRVEAQNRLPPYNAV